MRGEPRHCFAVMSFVRNVEDFVCGNCGTAVKGNGYTNHCPNCLFSKHVDIEPGDRAQECGGLMEPIRVEGSTGKGYQIRQRCTRCRHEFRVRAAENDNVDVLVSLAGKDA